MLGYANNSSKGGSNSPLELPPLPQILSLEPITLGNQKHGCTGDIKRVFGLPLMNMSDGNSPGMSQPRHFHPAATEELKNIKESVESGLRKAKDRSNMFRESILKLEKFRDNLNSRKRQRSENVSGEKSGAELEKMGAQIRGNPRDAINQRQEQRPKSSVVVKRVRTSIGEARADSKVVTSSRQPSLLERNEERFQISKATLSRNIEKIHKVAGGGEVWEKKIKRKRSVTAVGNRLLNGDGEQKPLLPAKPSTDQKLRSCDSQTLRSKTYFGMNGTNRLGSRTESRGANSSTLLKNDPDIVYSPKDRMDMFESRVPLKGSSTNIQEGDVASSPGSSIKGKLSRIPRAGSGLAADPSPSSPSMHGGCAEDFELPLKANKISPLVIPGDKKHSLGSSSQPMAQWVGQRTHKKSRLRRANLVSPLLNPAEKSHNLSEDLGLLDCSARIANTGSDGSLHDYNSIKGYAKVKKELEKSPSPFGVLESDESGAWENGLKGNGVDGGEVSLTTSLNAGDFVLPGKKQKWTSHEHGGVRKHGRSGRGLSQSKIGIPPGREKMADSPGGNLPQSLYHGSDKGRSKSGRTSTGKSKDRGPMTRVGPLLNGSSYECTGEFDDDRETLVAAANSARNFSNLAFSGPFWPKIKRLFGSVNVDNESFSFLKQQHHPEEEFNESMFSGVNNDILENVGLKEDSDHSGGLQRNQLYQDKDESRNSALSGKFNLGKLDKVTPLYERILSALIEDENEEIYHNGEGKISSLQCVSDDSHCGSCNHIDGEFRDRMESEVESTVDVCNQKVGFLDKVYCDKSATSCSLKSLSASMYSNDHSIVDDDYCHSDAGMVSETCSNDLGQMLKKESSTSACSYPDSQYEMMSLDERLMLELRSIDLYPDMLPDLSEGGETIHNNIAELRKDLRQKVDAKNDSLVKIEKALVNENVVEKRKLEETAMNKLMEMAYKKRMACRGSNLSKAAVRKVPKQVALAFIKRTLARYRKYKDTGISSFADPSLAEILFSPSMDAKSGDCVGSGTASNTLNDASNNQQELRGAGYSHGENAGEKPGSTLHKGRKKEMHIDDVGCTSSKMAALEGTATPIGPKGKRGERHKNLNSPLNGKAKLKQKTNNLHPTQRPVSRPESEVTLGSRGNDLQMDASDDPLDLARIGLDGGQEDLTTILDFDMDGEQDPEAAVGLEIPPWDDVGLEVPPWDDQFVFGL